MGIAGETPAEDPASTLTHHGGLDVGISLNCGDTHKWIGGLAGCSHNGFGTYGHGHGDKNQVMYFTPRVNGIQIGASYIPDTGQEHASKALNDNDNSAWAVGGNYVGDFGDGLNIAVSLGHYQADQSDMDFDYISGAAPASGGTDKRVTKGKLAADEKAWKAFEFLNDPDDPTTIADPTPGVAGITNAERNAAIADISRNGLLAQDNIMAATDGSMMKGGNKTFSNAALQVSMGSFSFGVVYATNDGGAYTTMTDYMVVNANDTEDRAAYLALLNETPGSYQSTDGTATGTVTRRGDDTALTASVTADGSDIHLYRTGGTDAAPTYAVESATNNDPANDIVMQKVVEDESKNWDTWGAGVKYSDGPMAVSLSHLSTEWDNGDEQEATMLSLSYSLAPGVASKSSIVTAERSFASGRDIEGTAFVTGITIGF